jgi:hypothetical protein
MKKTSVLFASLLSSSAFAVGPDYTALTSGIDLTTTIAAVMAVAVIGLGFILARGGAKTVMNFVKGALH